MWPRHGSRSSRFLTGPTFILPSRRSLASDPGLADHDGLHRALGACGDGPVVPDHTLVGIRRSPRSPQGQRDWLQAHASADVDPGRAAHDTARRSANEVRTGSTPPPVPPAAPLANLRRQRSLMRPGHLVAADLVLILAVALGAFVANSASGSREASGDELAAALTRSFIADPTLNADWLVPSTSIECDKGIKVEGGRTIQQLHDCHGRADVRSDRVRHADGLRRRPYVRIAGAQQTGSGRL